MTDKTITPMQKEPPPVPVVPRQVAAPPPPPPPPTAVAATVQPQTSGRVMTDLPLNSTDLAMVLVATVLVGLVALIPRTLVTRYLVGQRATPGAARSAGWSVWLLFVALALVALVGTLGRLWTVLVFYAPSAAVLVLLTILTVMLFARAQRTHR